MMRQLEPGHAAAAGRPNAAVRCWILPAACAAALCLAVLPLAAPAAADDPAADKTAAPAVGLAAEPAAPATPAERVELYKKFEQTLNNVTLKGNYTIAGNEARPPKEDRYEITSVTKLEAGDFWLFKARLKYGDVDAVVPMPLEVKWAGNTPVITLDKLTIPGLGTFDAHIIIDGNRYAGTWQHGQAGGQMWGVIEKKTAEKPAEK